MGVYILRRFGLMLLTLFGMSVLIFVMLRLVPGNISDILFESAGLVNPAEKKKIEAELWGMIDRWLQAGKPLDNGVRHPMGPWAATIGGILMVNGFEDFLANYLTTRAVTDAIRESLGILAFHAGRDFSRVGKLAEIAVTQGLAKSLLPGVDPKNVAACQRVMGKHLPPTSAKL